MQKLQSNNTLGKEAVKKALFQVNMSTVLKLGLDLNHIYLLEKLEINAPIVADEKIKAWLQGLVRKGFLTSEFVITESGGVLLDELRVGEDSVEKALQ